MTVSDLWETPADTATFSDDGRYRYDLTRNWPDNRGTRTVAWIGLNPSTATAEVNDPTLHRCIHFSKRWGFDRLVMLNLFALRSPDPAELLASFDPIGPDNAETLRRHIEAETTELVMAAWGAYVARTSDKGIARLAPESWAHQANKAMCCLGRTADGFPKHPMARGRHRVPDDQQPMPFGPWDEPKGAPTP